MRVSYTEEQRARQKASNCSLFTIDLDTPKGRMTYQGSLNERGMKWLQKRLNELIDKQREFRP